MCGGSNDWLARPYKAMLTQMPRQCGFHLRNTFSGNLAFSLLCGGGMWLSFSKMVGFQGIREQYSGTFAGGGFHIHKTQHIHTHLPNTLGLKWVGMFG